MNKIKIDLERRLGRVDRRIYGGFIEHLGRCIYGGIFDKGSPLSDEHGFRRDVMEAIRGLQLPIMRWPGGNFVSGYHWIDGVGPVEERPRNLELAWHSEETNLFGTNEFLHYCQLMNIEPYICVNIGNGTMDEAQAWVEYCNGTGNTYWANLRRMHGHAEPYRVKYWGLGNEMYGDWQIGALNADDYVKKAREFAKVMKWTDPTIELVSCGWDGLHDWDRIVLEGLAAFVNYHSIHIYTGSDNYYDNIFAAHKAERALHNCKALIEQVRYTQKIKHPISVAYDEWNVWFRTTGETGLEERYTLTDALVIATYLNIFIRACNTVTLANLAQTVNVIAPIFTSKDGLFLQTIYHPLRLYAEYMQEIALDSYVDSELYQQGTEHLLENIAAQGPFKLLDVTTTCDAEGKVVAIGVVNRDLEREHATTLQLIDVVVQHEVEVYEISGADVKAVNSFEQPYNVSVQERRFSMEGHSFEYVFPPHSLTLLRFQVERDEEE